MKKSFLILCAMMFAGIAFAANEIVIANPQNNSFLKGAFDANFSFALELDTNKADGNLWLDIDNEKNNNEIFILKDKNFLDAGFCKNDDNLLSTPNNCSVSFDSKTMQDREYSLNVSIETNSSIKIVDSIKVFIDNSFPAIELLNPQNGSIVETTHPIIAIKIEDRAGINANSIKLIVDGKQFTASSVGVNFNADQNKLVFFPQLEFEKEKMAQLSIEASDLAGNNLRKEFSFSIDSTAPKETGNLSAIEEKKSIRLNWSKPETGFAGIKEYEVYRSNSMITEQNKQGFLTAKTATESFVDSNVINGENYYYAVIAIDYFSRKSPLSGNVIGKLSGFSIEFETEKVFLQRNQSKRVSARITNNSSQRIEALLNAESSDADVKAGIEKERIELNIGEETSIGVNLNAFDFTNAEVKINAILPEKTFSDAISVNVTNEQDIVIEQLSSRFCKNNFSEKIKIRARNETGIRKEIILRAESEMLIPTLIPSSIALNSGEEREVELQISAPEAISLEKQKVLITAISNDSINNFAFEFSPIECREEKTTISIRLTDTACAKLNKKTSKQIKFVLNNYADKEQEIELFVQSELKTVLQKSKTILKANGSEELWLEAIGEETIKAGKKDVNISAFSRDSSAAEIACVELLPEREIEWEIEKEEKSILQGSASAIKIFLKNTGDSVETIHLGFDEKDDAAFSFSSNDFGLEAFESKEVYLSISPKENSIEGKKITTLYLENKDKTIRGFKAVSFIVQKKSAELKQGIISISSFPTRIEAKEGEKIGIFFVLENKSAESLDSIIFSIAGETSIMFSAPDVRELKAGETIRIKGIIEIPEKAKRMEETIKIRANSTKYFDEKEITVKIIPKKIIAKKDSRIFAGFFSFAEKNAFGIIIGIITGIILFWLFGTIGGKKQPIIN